MDPARLSGFSVFAELDQSALEAIAAVASEAEVEPGQVLATEGDFAHAMYAIEEGTADVALAGAVVRTLGPGEVFGEIAILSSGRRTATVTAVTSMRLISLFKRDVWTLEQRSPAVAERLRALIAERRDPAAAGSPASEPSTG